MRGATIRFTVNTITHITKTPTQLKIKFTASIQQQQITCQQFYKQPVTVFWGTTQCSFDDQTPNYR